MGFSKLRKGLAKFLLRKFLHQTSVFCRGHAVQFALAPLVVVVINKLLNSRFELIISFKAIDVDILILFYLLLYNMIFSKCKSSQSMTARKIHVCPAGSPAGHSFKADAALLSSGPRLKRHAGRLDPDTLSIYQIWR